MENHISNLENYTIKPEGSNEDPVQRCRFFYVHNDNLWKEFDVEGHQDLESAFELAKDTMAADIVHMALKESVKSLDIPSKNFHFEKDGDVEDLRDYTFDKSVLNRDSELFSLFKQLLMDNWNEDMSWYYFRVDYTKNVNIHDDTDKKLVYDHYFEGLKEFEDRISFLEYYNTINLDSDDTIGDQKIHYGFTECGDYYCIDDNITRDDLYRFLRGNGIRIQRKQFLINVVTWAAFSYYYGMNNGLSDIESISFAKTVVSMIMRHDNGSPMGLPNEFTKDIDTTKYFKESLIRTTVEKILYRKISGNMPDYIKEIFLTIFDIYKNHIQHFEYKTKRLEFRVSQRQYDRFMALNGESKSDKLNNLIEFPIADVNYSLLPDIIFEEESVNNWLDSNEETVESYFGDVYYDWIMPKPSLEMKYGRTVEINHVNFEFGYISPEERSFIEGDFGGADIRLGLIEEGYGDEKWQPPEGFFEELDESIKDINLFEIVDDSESEDSEDKE